MLIGNLVYKLYHGSGEVPRFSVISESGFQHHTASGAWQKPVPEVAGRGGLEGLPLNAGHSHGAQDPGPIPVHHHLSEWLRQAVSTWDASRSSPAETVKSLPIPGHRENGTVGGWWGVRTGGTASSTG